MPDPTMIPMISPSGATGMIPQDRVNEAIQKNYVPGVLLRSKETNRLGIIPRNNFVQAMSSGKFTLESNEPTGPSPEGMPEGTASNRFVQGFGLPTSAEEAQAAIAEQRSPTNILKQGLLGPVGGFAYDYGKQQITENIPEFLRKMAETGTNIGEQGLNLNTLGKGAEAFLSGGVNAVPIIGKPEETAGEDITKGNYAGAAGGLGSVLLQLAIPNILRGGRATVQRIGKMAPEFAETSLGVTAKERGFQKTPGEAAIAETKGIMPGTVLKSVKEALYNRVGPRISGAYQALTDAGVKINIDPVLKVLSDKLTKALDGNNLNLAKDLYENIKRLTIDPYTGQFTNEVSPSKLWSMKDAQGDRGNWNPNADLKKVAAINNEVYGAMDRLLDQTTDANGMPGVKTDNQVYSSLKAIEAQAQAKELAPGIIQKSHGRLAAKTGATVAGIVTGATLGGVPGAAIGGALGIVAPELVTHPATSMAIARLLHKVGQMGEPISLGKNPVAAPPTVTPPQGAPTVDQLMAPKPNAPTPAPSQLGKPGPATGALPPNALAVGDTFIDTKGEPRRVTAIEGNKIKTQDGTPKTYTDKIEFQEFNSPQSQIAQGGKIRVAPEEDAAKFMELYSRSVQENAADPTKGIGATYSVAGHRDLSGEPGISVAEYGTRKAFKGDPTPKDVQKFIAENADALAKKDRAIGIWKDPDSGLSEMEVVRIHPDETSAMKSMVQGGQDAGFDLHDKKIIESARQYPPLEEFLSLAKIGESWKNWYQYAQALRPVLGERFNRFMAISAADSANTQLTTNIRETFEAYRLMNEWEANPSQFKEVAKAFPGQTKLTPAIVGKLMGSELNMRNASTKAPNLFKAYTESAVEGPKVEAYLQNLLGNFDPSVIDIYMQRAGGVTNLDVGARRAITQRVERTAETLGWKNAQGQASIWGPVRLIFDRIAKRASQGGMTREMAGKIGESLTREEVAKHYEDVVTLILDNKGVRDAATKFGFSEADFKRLESARSELKLSKVKKQAYDPAVLRRVGERLYDLYWDEQRLKASAESVKSSKALAKEEADAAAKGIILPRKMTAPRGFTSSVPPQTMKGVLLNYGMQNLNPPAAPGGYNYRR